MMALIKTAPAIDSTNLLNLMNVKYVVSTPPITSPDFELVYSYDPIPQDPQEREEFEKLSIIKIYENKKMFPHAFLVPQCEIKSSEDEYKETLQKKSFNPEKVLLLDAEPKTFPCKGEGVGKKQGSVRIESYESNTVDLTVDSQSRQFLFLGDSYYPGWKAYVDDEEVEVLRANYLFRAIVIEPGEHQVRFEYDPLSFRLGLAISTATILLCGIYCLVAKNRRILNQRAANHFSRV